MAKFSQGFLSSLGRPAFSQSLFDLGAAIGGVPQQMQKRDAAQQQQKQADALARGEQALMKYASARGMNLRTPEGREGFFRIANSYSIPVDRANAIYESMLSAAPEPAKPISVSPGGALVSPSGEVLYERGFKPTQPRAAPRPQTVIKELEGSLYVFRDGVLTETVTPEKTPDLKEREANLSRVAQLVRSKEDIKTLLGPEYQASGITGKLSARFLAGSDAYDRAQIINSLKSTLGLEQIANLKRLSSTGATGLGQVSNLELNALQSEIASLDVGMSEDAQIRSLTKIYNHLDSAQKAASGVMPADQVPWESPAYRAAGYAKDPQTGVVFYAPFGEDGDVFVLRDGKFVKAEI